MTHDTADPSGSVVYCGYIQQGNTMAKRQMFITKEIRDRIPKLYAQDGKGDEAIVYVKWFCPWNQWTWFATEMDPETGECFGLVVGHETELGYFSTEELKSLTHWSGLYIERDYHWTPKTLGKVREEVAKVYGR